MENINPEQEVLIEELFTSLKDLKAATDCAVDKAKETKESIKSPDALLISIALYMINVTEKHNKVAQHMDVIIKSKINAYSDMEDASHEHM